MGVQIKIITFIFNLGSLDNIKGRPLKFNIILTTSFIECQQKVSKFPKVLKLKCLEGV